MGANVLRSWESVLPMTGAWAGKDSRLGQAQPWAKHHPPQQSRHLSATQHTVVGASAPARTPDTQPHRADPEWGVDVIYSQEGLPGRQL